MLARLHVFLPFEMLIPKNKLFNIQGIKIGDYEYFVHPPEYSGRDLSSKISEVKIDGRDAYIADTLRIDFSKESFNRENVAINESNLFFCDPPIDLFSKVVNSYLSAIRNITKASQIHLVEFSNPSSSVEWRISYLNDDGTELEKDENFIRGRGTLSGNFSWVTITPDIWDEINRFVIDPPSLAWNDMLLDAVAAIPEVGQALVLAETALEIFISYILDKLSDNDSSKKEMWSWITSRDWLKQPTVEEQFDSLLKIFTGRSLKEDILLWNSFKNLKSARNAFVHDGIARIGKNSEPVTADKVQKFIQDAWAIIAFVRESIPEDLRWKEYNFQNEVSFKSDLFTKKLGN